eukprot:1422338-Rhodomonas_salina.1
MRRTGTDGSRGHADRGGREGRRQASAARILRALGSQPLTFSRKHLGSTLVRAPMPKRRWKYPDPKPTTRWKHTGPRSEAEKRRWKQDVTIA